MSHLSLTTFRYHNLESLARIVDCEPENPWYRSNLLKILKGDIPLRLTVNIIGSPTYGLAQHLANLLQPFWQHQHIYLGLYLFSGEIKILYYKMEPRSRLVSFDTPWGYRWRMLWASKMVSTRSDNHVPALSDFHIQFFYGIAKCINKQREIKWILPWFQWWSIHIWRTLKTTTSDSLNTTIADSLVWVHYVDNIFVIGNKGGEEYLNFLIFLMVFTSQFNWW